MRPERFVFNKKEYQYFWHPYNTGAERTIEIPIIVKILQMYSKEAKILEVGNVLQHYFRCCHDIVDKYERGKGIINEDIVDYNPGYSYDLIISISTIEHIGRDEKEKEPEKVIQAIKHTRNLLSPEGWAIITFPVGYNQTLDHAIKSGSIQFDEMYFMERISKDNEWRQCTQEVAFSKLFGRPFSYGNAIVFGVINSEARRNSSRIL